MDQPYNGSSVLVKKIESLLGEKRMSTPVAVRLILELQIEAIKQNYKREEEIRLVKEEMKYSWGIWAAHNPRKAFVIVVLIYSFAISDIRQPVMAWVIENIKTLLSLI